LVAGKETKTELDAGCDGQLRSRALGEKSRKEEILQTRGRKRKRDLFIGNGPASGTGMQLIGKKVTRNENSKSTTS